MQTIDLGPTLLEYFDVPRPADTQGRPLRGVLADDTPIREAGLFGIFGGHVNVTDGRHVYMRGRFTPAELAGAKLAEPFDFTKGVPTLRVPGRSMINPSAYGTLLYDLDTDPEQTTPIEDDEVELRMAGLLTELLRATDAPDDQYLRLGLPRTGPVTAEHLLIRAQWERARTALRPLPPVGDLQLMATISLIGLAALPVARVSVEQLHAIATELAALEAA